MSGRALYSARIRETIRLQKWIETILGLSTNCWLQNALLDSMWSILVCISVKDITAVIVISILHQSCIIHVVRNALQSTPKLCFMLSRKLNRSSANQMVSPASRLQPLKDFHSRKTTQWYLAKQLATWMLSVHNFSTLEQPEVEHGWFQPPSCLPISITEIVIYSVISDAMTVSYPVIVCGPVAYPLVLYYLCYESSA